MVYLVNNFKLKDCTELFLIYINTPTTLWFICLVIRQLLTMYDSNMHN